MEMLQYFMKAYFNISYNFKDLDDIIKEFNELELKIYLDEFVNDLEDILKNVQYDEARLIIHKCGRPFSKRLTEEFIRYLHARLKNKKPRLTLEELFKIR
jgi:hypothetical protein